MLSGKRTHKTTLLTAQSSDAANGYLTRYTTITLLTDDVCFKLRDTIQKMWLYFDTNKTNRPIMSMPEGPNIVIFLLTINSFVPVAAVAQR